MVYIQRGTVSAIENLDISGLFFFFLPKIFMENCYPNYTPGFCTVLLHPWWEMTSVTSQWYCEILIVTEIFRYSACYTISTQYLEASSRSWLCLPKSRMGNHLCPVLDKIF